MHPGAACNKIQVTNKTAFRDKWEPMCIISGIFFFVPTALTKQFHGTGLPCKADSSSASQGIPYFIEIEISSVCSWKSITGSYPELVEYSPHFHTLFLWDQF